jgi:hypothetical protein
MMHTTSRRALVAVAALSFAAGCAGNSSTSSSFATGASQARSGMRVLRGPDVLGPRIVAAIPQKPNAPAGWPDHHKKKKSFLFVADGNSGVLIYNPKTVNGSPTGSITTGVSAPAGLAVDKSGALYVANEGTNTVTVYPKGMTSPSLTISTGISGPYGIGVDSKGNVFVSNLNNNTVTAYAAGSTSPYETINFNAYGQAVGVGIDAMDNVWVACDTTSKVFEIPAGTTKVNNAGLTGLGGSLSVAFGQKDVIYVSNVSLSDVTVYAYGTTAPSATITTGIEKYGPTLGGFTAANAYFQSNQFDNVVGYKSGQTSPFSTLSGATSPLGIASRPLVSK